VKNKNPATAGALGKRLCDFVRVVNGEVTKRTERREERGLNRAIGKTAITGNNREKTPKRIASAGSTKKPQIV